MNEGGQEDEILTGPRDSQAVSRYICSQGVTLPSAIIRLGNQSWTSIPISHRGGLCLGWSFHWTEPRAAYLWTFSGRSVPTHSLSAPSQTTNTGQTERRRNSSENSVKLSHEGRHVRSQRLKVSVPLTSCGSRRMGLQGDPGVNETEPDGHAAEPSSCCFLLLHGPVSGTISFFTAGPWFYCPS